MANRKVEYEDDKVYRKNIDLTGKIIKKLDALAKKESREFKPFVELKLNELVESNKKK